VLEAQRAEAANLESLGQLELESYPSATVAFTIASLELADRPSARRLALEALWEGPTAFIANKKPTSSIRFTPDGRSLVQGFFGEGDGRIRLINIDGSNVQLTGTLGHEKIVFPRFFSIPEFDGNDGLFAINDWGVGSSTSNFMVTRKITFWSAPTGRKLAEAHFENVDTWVGSVGRDSASDRMVVLVPADPGVVRVDVVDSDGTHRRLGTHKFEVEVDPDTWKTTLEKHSGKWIAASTGHEVYVIEIRDHDLSKPRLVARQESLVTHVSMDPLGRYVVTTDQNGRIRLWNLAETSPPRILKGAPGWPYVCGEGSFLCAGNRRNDGEFVFQIWSLEDESPVPIRRIETGVMKTMSKIYLDSPSRHVVRSGADDKIRLWPMSAPADAEPVLLKRGDVGKVFSVSVDRHGRWVAGADGSGVAIWSLDRPPAVVIRRHEGTVNSLVFGPEGRWIASSSGDGTISQWPLDGEVPRHGRVIFSIPRSYLSGVALSSQGDQLLVGGANIYGVGFVHLVSSNGESSRELPTEVTGQYSDTAFSPDGRFVAAACAGVEQGRDEIVVWDRASGEQLAVVARGESALYANPVFLGNEHIMALGRSGLQQWNLESGVSEVLHEGSFSRYAASGDGRRVLLLETAEEEDPGRAVFVDLDSGATTRLDSHGDLIWTVGLDADGEIAVTGDIEGTVRVELLGHESTVLTVVIDPLGRWVASGGRDQTIRLWPMPDLSRPPLHTLPREELIAKLKTLTNLRVVRDEESPTGWKLTHDPFPGWETVPEW
jgi:WD40 repeat protein